ncbi:MAG TPA: protein phosphatase 2C domain-containing protein [Acetobacteraceae bacterium]|nr:protein phosphatase 2C domain-containing protein [Acetobacteraceae bacterium]
MTARFRSWAATHAGAVRTHNEDSFVNRPDIGLWAVADGAGGHEAGEVASGQIAAVLDSVPSGLSASEMLAQVRLRIADTHASLRVAAAERGPRAMIASTIVVLILRDGHFACLWAGDSRAYRLRGGELTQITRDHSLVQELVDSGAITAEEAEGHPRANVITRAVGTDDETIDLDKVMDRVLPGDRFLLCSDGLSKTLPAGELRTLLGMPDGVPPPELLIAAALARGVNDNVTAVAVETLST